jgi:chromosome partitioning protein
MKSTLATVTALEATKNDIDVAVADLDVENRTITSWMNQRKEYGIKPLFKVYTVNSAREALNCFQNEQLSIIDAPSRATSATIEIALNSDLIIQPTTPGKKDMDLGIETFVQLIKKGVPIEKLLFIITRIGSDSEYQKAIQYLNYMKINDKNIKILSSAIWEKVSYRSAINDGLAITETPYPTLNDGAKAVIYQILTLLIK